MLLPSVSDPPSRTASAISSDTTMTSGEPAARTVLQRAGPGATTAAPPAAMAAAAGESRSSAASSMTASTPARLRATAPSVIQRQSQSPPRALIGHSGTLARPAGGNR